MQSLFLVLGLPLVNGYYKPINSSVLVIKSVLFFALCKSLLLHCKIYPVKCITTFKNQNQEFKLLSFVVLLTSYLFWDSSIEVKSFIPNSKSLAHSYSRFLNSFKQKTSFSPITQTFLTSPLNFHLPTSEYAYVCVCVCTCKCGCYGVCKNTPLYALPYSSTHSYHTVN